MRPRPTSSRCLANIPLSDEEQAAIDDGHAALDQLLQRLVDTPTPAGATPREIGVPASATLLPITAVNHADSARSATQVRQAEVHDGGGNILETGTASYRLAHARAQRDTGAAGRST